MFIAVRNFAFQPDWHILCHCNQWKKSVTRKNFVFRLLNMNIQILMIDNNLRLCRLVKEYLEQREFAVAFAHTASQGLEKAASGDYQLVILEAVIPGTRNFEILKRIRAVSTIPMLILTTLGDETSRIDGLESGADDYMAKSFSSRELLARLRAIVRRSKLSPVQPKRKLEVVTVGDIKLNASTRTVMKSEQALTLTSLEFDLLWCLASAAGRVIDREKLLDEAAGRNYGFMDRSVDVHISSLRRKLGDDPKNPRYIRTVRSVGYILLNGCTAVVAETAESNAGNIKIKRRPAKKIFADSLIPVSC